MILKTENGRPLVTASEPAWIKAVQDLGPEKAWRQLLREFHQLGLSAEEAEFYEGAFAYAVMKHNLPMPSVFLRDRWLIEEYGPSAAKIVLREQERADRQVREYMRETGLPEEEARRALVKEMLEGMRFITKGIKSGELQEIADAIRLIEKCEEDES